MPLLPQTPAFIPPVVAVPAANAIVPFVAPAAAAVAGSAGLVAGAPLVAAAAVGLGVGLLAGLAGAQLWGSANNPAIAPSNALPEPEPSWTEAGTVTPSDPGRALVLVSESGWAMGSPPPGAAVQVFRSYQQILGGTFADGYTYRYRWIDPASGLLTYGCLGGGNSCGVYDGVRTGPLPNLYWKLSETPEDPTPAPLPVVPWAPAPVPDRAIPAPLEAEPESLPEAVPLLPVVIPLAPPTPARPAPVPVPAVAPNPGRPAVVPQAPPPTLPYAPARPQPAGVPISTAGTVTPQAPPGPTTTPTGTHFPGGVPIPSNPPQATLQGMAEELGRIEKKLAMVLNPKGTGIGDLLDQIDEYARLAARVWEALSSLTAGGSYPLSSPCVLDENDERVVSEVEYSGALGAFGVLSNKIDALAELLQVHKDLKQPICRHKAEGQPVTVTFTQQ